MSTFVFRSKRLLCRRWLPTDLEPLFAVYSDVEAMRYVGDGTAITLGECRAWLEVTEANYAQRGYGMFTLVESEAGSVVGFAGLVHPGGRPEPEIKYALRRSHWGRGLASEAVVQLLNYGARTHGLERVVATVASGNLASQRVLAKAGMKLAHARTHDQDGSVTLVFEWRESKAG